MHVCEEWAEDRYEGLEAVLPFHVVEAGSLLFLLSYIQASWFASSVQGDPWCQPPISPRSARITDAQHCIQLCMWVPGTQQELSASYTASAFLH